MRSGSRNFLSAVVATLDLVGDTGKGCTRTKPYSNAILMGLFCALRLLWDYWLQRSQHPSLYSSPDSSSSCPLEHFRQQENKMFKMRVFRGSPALLGLLDRWLPWVRSHKSCCLIIYHLGNSPFIWIAPSWTSKCSTCRNKCSLRAQKP